MYRLSFIFLKFFAVFALFACVPLYAFASGSFFAGTTYLVYPCLNLPGSSLIGIQNGNSKTLVVFEKGFSRETTGTSTPARGSTIYGILETGPKCISLGLLSSTDTILVYEVTTPDALKASHSNTSKSGNASVFGSLFSSLLSSLGDIFSGSIPTPGGGGSSGDSGGAGIGVSVTSPFGGQILTPPIPCIDPPGSWIVTLGPPTAGIYKYIPGVSMTYLYGPPLIPGQWTLGSAVPEVCVTAPGATPLPVMLMMSVGTSLAPSSGSGQKNPPTQSSGNYCKNTANNQYTASALEQYGGNLLSGNVPGLTNLCPNFNSLNADQRVGFWTNFVNAVELPESGCNPNNTFREANGQLSQGLLQLSYGDSAKGAPGACHLTPANILDPKTNITCGVAIMNGLSTNGITNGNKGMDAYWSTLRAGKSSLANVQAVMSSFPGCH